MAEVAIELLNKKHERTSFDCGVEELNDYLKTRAGQQSRKNYSKTWVAVPVGYVTVVGYLTLSMGSVELDEISEQLLSRLPRHPMPVLHVGRLAVDLRVQGKGIGSLLLAFACEQCLSLAATVGCYGLQLDAKTPEVMEFYQAKGFQPLSPGSRKLILPIRDIEANTSAQP
jgi:GNAT superfamily N-acetyltransferase